MRELAVDQCSQTSVCLWITLECSYNTDSDSVVKPENLDPACLTSFQLIVKVFVYRPPFNTKILDYMKPSGITSASEPLTAGVRLQ